MGFFGKLFGANGDEPLPEQAILLDVRSPAEFAAGHLRDAVLLPVSELARSIDSVVPDKSRPIIVYCQSGARSAAAQQQLCAMGYRQVVNGGGVHALAQRMQREILR
ncbi:rhodanese-like domain-containing protein [Noviherbaspirillum sp. UKPF54]|uniref:rhodanese-like domain-containing protein n=1 Tax=Noviherbaspirillum sp. UKPF54 TaxID=2601898 RepID=UPI0011B182E8|nr:rhodanese-like domain-containing protein [Noviherbaspirillum sp. UKPF54]QDZ28087.1 rhodanese-like domain-containing protein [Noviherbaspirillum sp. UKPF54]